MKFLFLTLCSCLVISLDAMDGTELSAASPNLHDRNKEKAIYKKRKQIEERKKKSEEDKEKDPDWSHKI